MDHFLPRFSDPRDVDEFVEMLEKFERGELTPDKFRTFRLTRGVYGQRQEGVQMIRVKIPQGVLAPEQCEALAAVSERYTPRAIGHITTRQNVQFHFVKLGETEAMLRELEAAGLTTREACGNTVRNIVADPLSGLTPDSLFDVRPYGEALTRHFLRADFDQALPRKFKITLSSTAADESLAAINDVGLIARVRNGAERGFKMVVAGGLSTSPQNAITLHEFLPVAELLDAVEAVVRIFDRTGNRENKHRARLKYVLRKHGEEAFRRFYTEERAAVAARGGTALTDLPPAHEPPPPARPAPASGALHAARGPGYLAWRASNVIDQVHAGYAAVLIRLVLGDFTAAQMRAVARIARAFGDGSVRTTLEQNLMLRFVPVELLPALHAALEAEGLGRAGARTVVDVTSCPGAETCNLAVTASRQLGLSISERLESLRGEAAEAREAAREATIKISGCPNSCGQHHVADLGFHGAVRKVGDKSAPVYQLHLGGGVDGETGATFGRQVIKIPARRVAEATERLLVLFARERTAGESVRAFFRRVSAETVQHVLADLAALDAGAAPETWVDLGQNEGFVVAIGAGECAA